MILSTWSWSVDAIENKANTTYEELNRRSEMSAVSKQLLFRGKLCHVIVGAKRQVKSRYLVQLQSGTDTA